MYGRKLQETGTEATETRENEARWHTVSWREHSGGESSGATAATWCAASNTIPLPQLQVSGHSPSAAAPAALPVRETFGPRTRDVHVFFVGTYLFPSYSYSNFIFNLSFHSTELGGVITR